MSRFRKPDDIKTESLHFNRYEIERKHVLEDLENIHILASDAPQAEKSWDRLERFFAGKATERELWDFVGRERDYYNALKSWAEQGSAIFTLRDDLVQMFLNTDVDAVPINSIHMPYPTVYCYLGDLDPFPQFHPDYRVDGFYLSGDGVAFWKHEPRPDIEKIRRNREVGLQHLLEVINNPERYKDDHVQFSLSHLEESGGADNYVEKGVSEAIERWEEAEDAYNRFLTDPDSFDYEEEGWLSYLSLSVDFTVTPKDGSVRQLSAERLLAEPFLHACYDFKTHRSTVEDAIKHNFSESTWAMEHHIGDRDMDPFDEMVVDPADPRYRDEREDLPDGYRRGSLYRLNSYLNVTNRPDLLQDMTRLVFNTLCYLNWKDKDVVLRYPNGRLNSEEAGAKGRKAQKQVATKARRAGYRKLYFCGYTYPRSEAGNKVTEGSIKSHWRRGHWRNQPFGKGLRDTKLIWIQPVIVSAKGAAIPEQPSIYKV